MLPLAQTSFLGATTKLYSDRLEYKMFAGLAGTLTIPVAQIASVHASPIIFWKIVVETAGGQHYQFFANPFQRSALVRAILAQANK